MPCRYEDDRTIMQRQRKDLDKLTRMLCFVMQRVDIELNDYCRKYKLTQEEHNLWDEVRAWWTEHQLEDERREEARKKEMEAELAREKEKQLRDAHLEAIPLETSRLLGWEKKPNGKWERR